MDIRSQRSKTSLREALIDCMKRKNFKDIAVTELCEEAGLNRTTFYKYYKSIDDILSELENEQLEEFRTILKEKKRHGKALLRTILYSLDRAEELYRTRYGGTFPESFKAGLVSVSKEYGMPAWKEKLPNVDERESELAYESLLAGSLHAALNADDSIPRERVENTILDMINSYIATHS